MTVLTSTAIMARLLVRREGKGYLLASVPVAAAELGARLEHGSEVPGYSTMRVSKGRAHFMLAEPYPFIDDVMTVPEDRLVRSRDALREVLNRVAVSGWDLKPLSKLEFEYLQRWVGPDNWCRGIPYLLEE